jgi:hypothetical protein
MLRHSCSLRSALLVAAFVAASGSVFAASGPLDAPDPPKAPANMFVQTAEGGLVPLPRSEDAKVVVDPSGAFVSPQVSVSLTGSIAGDPSKPGVTTMKSLTGIDPPQKVNVAPSSYRELAGTLREIEHPKDCDGTIRDCLM